MAKALLHAAALIALASLCFADDIPQPISGCGAEEYKTKYSCGTVPADLSATSGANANGWQFITPYQKGPMSSQFQVSDCSKDHELDTIVEDVPEFVFDSKCAALQSTNSIDLQLDVQAGRYYLVSIYIREDEAVLAGQRIMRLTVDDEIVDSSLDSLILQSDYVIIRKILMRATSAKMHVAVSGTQGRPPILNGVTISQIQDCDSDASEWYGHLEITSQGSIPEENFFCMRFGISNPNRKVGRDFYVVLQYESEEAIPFSALSSLGDAKVFKVGSQIWVKAYTFDYTYVIQGLQFQETGVFCAQYTPEAISAKHNLLDSYVVITDAYSKDFTSGVPMTVSHDSDLQRQNMHRRRLLQSEWSNTITNANSNLALYSASNIKGGNKNPNRKNVGAWSPLLLFPLVPIHLGTLREGNKIVTWSSWRPDGFGNGDSTTFTEVLDFDNPTARYEVKNPNHDMFCTGIVTLPDGSILASGGGDWVRKVSRFQGDEPVGNGQWQALPELTIERWYGSNIVLPNNGVIAALGEYDDGEPEIMDPQTMNWQKMPGADMKQYLDDYDNRGVAGGDRQWYPHLHHMSNGKILVTGQTNPMYWLDYQNPSFNYIRDRIPGNNEGSGVRMWSASIQVNPNQMLFVGGRDESLYLRAFNDANLITVNGDDVTVTRIQNMAYERCFPNCVIGANGDVFCFGGNTDGLQFSNTNPVYVPERLTRNDDGSLSTTWDQMEPATVERNYHSIATLLKDGRIMSAGGGLSGCGSCAINKFNGEIFYPPYLFNNKGKLIAINGRKTKKNRPTLYDPNNEFNTKIEVGIGGTFDILKKGGKKIAKFNMIRVSATTHSVNSDMRYFEPEFVKYNREDRYAITMPNDANFLIKGYYWLHAVNAKGIPSPGFNIHVV